MATKEENLLTKQGYKNTKARKAILAVLEHAPGIMSAEDIFLQVKEAHCSTNLSTIYRNLELLREKELLIKVIMQDGRARYQLKAEGHKHHLICINCYKKVPIDNCPLQKLQKELQESTQFDITDHRLELYGVCPDCKNHS